MKNNLISNKKQCLLAICIPTYNRYNKLKSMVENLLLCPRNDFEIIVQDNCSLDGTQNLKYEIKDERFKFIENQTNIGGIINGYGAMLSAESDYIMLCLDKDTVRADKLPLFLDFLKSNSNIKYGRCVLNAEIDNDPIVYTGLYERMSYFGYSGCHPSGTFFDVSLFKSLDIVPKILKSHSVFGFFLDMVDGECAEKTGDACFYKKQLMQTELPDDSAKKKSLTYDKKTMFFFPNNRIKQYKIFIWHLSTLTLPISVKNKMWGKIFIQGGYDSTLGFKHNMENSAAVSHYGIKTRHISFIELFGIGIKYVFSILFGNKRKSYFNVIR